MFKNMMIAAAVAVLQRAMCQIFGFCLDHEECPDGVCDPLLSELDSLDDDSPVVTMAPGLTQAPNFDIQWDQINELVQAGLTFIRALRSFLGLSNKVG